MAIIIYKINQACIYLYTNVFRALNTKVTKNILPCDGFNKITFKNINKY